MNTFSENVVKLKSVIYEQKTSLFACQKDRQYAILPYKLTSKSSE